MVTSSADTSSIDPLPIRLRQSGAGPGGRPPGVRPGAVPGPDGGCPWPPPEGVP